MKAVVYLGRVEKIVSGIYYTLPKIVWFFFLILCFFFITIIIIMKQIDIIKTSMFITLLNACFNNFKIVFVHSFVLTLSMITWF